MLLKISYNNVKKNIKDYSIYFLTLMIGVALVYAFNSLSSQSAFTSSMSDGISNITKSLFSMLSVLSKVVAVILAFLILYANDFLMKRRKKELGIYMILGMENRRISQIFVLEILMVGLFSFVAGIGVGLLLSQGISVIALKMFAFNLSSYQFTFSLESLKSTLISFAIIFVLVLLMNVRTINKVRLIELLKAGRVNQNHTFKGIRFSLGVFAFGLAMLGSVGYLVYEKNAIKPDSPLFSVSFILAVMGTACIIYSIFGVLLDRLRAMERWYFKGLNAFFIRQISSKIQTNYITVTVVCLLLSATICVVATGMGMALAMNENTKDATPYDVTIYQKLDPSVEQTSGIAAFLKKIEMPEAEVFESTVDVTLFVDPELTYGDVIFNPQQLWSKDHALLEDPLPIISLTDYNTVRVSQNLEPITLAPNTYALNAYYDGTNALLEAFISSKAMLRVNGSQLNLGKEVLLQTIYYITPINSNDQGTLIVDDSLVEGLQKLVAIKSGRYFKDLNQTAYENLLLKEISDIKSPFSYYSKEKLKMMYYGTFAMASFVCCYVGIVFLIISVAILSLQQLTETADNIYRYELLQKLGVERATCLKLILKQIAVYFGTPLLLALIYSGVVLPKVIDKLSTSMDMQIGPNVHVTLGLFIIIYGSYFVITYLSCRNMVVGKVETSKA